MKTRRDGAFVTTIPSVRNSSGLRVFIPEKGRRAGRRWFQKYTLHTLGALQEVPLCISFTGHVMITVHFSFTDTVLTTPFTLPYYRYYLRQAATLNRTARSFQLHADDQSEESLPEDKKAEFQAAKNDQKYHDAKLIVALRGGKFRTL